MGDDTALPPLAGRPRPVFSYLRQRFAQVTNPAIDHLREQSLMSLRDTARTACAAPRGERGRRPAGRARELLPLPFGAVGALGGIEVSTALGAGRDAPRRVRPDRGRRASPLVRAGRGAPARPDGRRASLAVPGLLAVGAVQQRLVASGRRADMSLVVVSDEPRDSHHVACLLGFGADAVCPRLALETTAALAAADRLGGDQALAGGGPAALPSRGRGRRAEGDGEDGHRRRRVIPGRAALRRARTGARGGRPLLHRRRLRSSAGSGSPSSSASCAAAARPAPSSRRPDT